MYRALTISAALCLCGAGSAMGEPPCKRVYENCLTGGPDSIAIAAIAAP